MANNATRTPAQLRALRARVTVLARRRDGALVAAHPALGLVAEVRAETSAGWTKARQEERNGWLRPADAPQPAPPCVPDPIRAAHVRDASADLENTGRLGISGMARLVHPHRELICLAA